MARYDAFGFGKECPKELREKNPVERSTGGPETGNAGLDGYSVLARARGEEPRELISDDEEREEALERMNTVRPGR